MNGPEHYREAQQALRYAFSGDDSNPEMTLAAAQVHATLALAAATINAAFAIEGIPGEAEAWIEVTQ